MLVANRFSWEIVQARVINSGLVFYGGLLGAILCIVLLARYMKRSAVEMLNFSLPCFAAFHCLGRVGCLLEGCCYGKPAGWGVKMAGEDFTRVPVQLIEAIVIAGIVAVLLLLEHNYNKKKQTFNLLPFYFLMYAPARFIIEIWRGDELRGVTHFDLTYVTGDGSFPFSFELSTSQFISLSILAGLAVWWLFGYLRRRAPKNGGDRA